MTQLREFVQRSSEFDKLGVSVVALSVDDQEHARKVWEEIAQRKFTILSDPGAKVIKQYGLLHAAGHSGEDIAIRATYLIDPKGREAWRRVSESVPDIPTADEVLQRIRKSQEQASGVDKNH
jgi:peroxiredoxin